jgi:hypothetical protein
VLFLGLMQLLGRGFDRFARTWSAAVTTARVGQALVVLFIGALAVIEMGRRGWLPASLDPWISTSHFGAVNLVFAVLLLLELLSMVVAVPSSTAVAFGKQLEVISLLLLRSAVHELPHVGEPINWELARAAIGPMVADIAGGLAIFGLLGLHVRAPRREALRGEAALHFIAAKKVIALGLLVVLSWVVLEGLLHHPQPGRDLFHFMATAFTVLVFSDVLLMLVALQYTADYRVVFRNAGYTAITILMRISLTAPDYLNAALGVGAALAAVGLAWMVHWFPAGDPTPHASALPADPATGDHPASP